jgi:hypothetical protein
LTGSVTVPLTTSTAVSAAPYPKILANDFSAYDESMNES